MTHLQWQQAIPGVHIGAAAVQARIPQQRNGERIELDHQQPDAQLHPRQHQCSVAIIPQGNDVAKSLLTNLEQDLAVCAGRDVSDCTAAACEQ